MHSHKTILMRKKCLLVKMITVLFVKNLLFYSKRTSTYPEVVAASMAGYRGLNVRMSPAL